MKTNKMLPDSSISKVWENFRKMNGIVIEFLANNWVSQNNGTFTNTVFYEGFTSDEILEIDLYDDGTLTETQISEYDGYITEFNVEDGKLIAIATTKPTQSIKILARGEIVGKMVVNGGSSSNISASNVSCLDKDGQTSNVQKELDEQNKNFEWKLVGTANGKNPISLPSNFNELFVDVGFFENNDTFMGSVIPKIAITETEADRLLPGGYWNASGRWITIIISTTSVKIRDFMTNGQDASNTCKLYVYYR